MIGIINKIGQRKSSKLICGLSFLSSLILQVLAYGAGYAATIGLWIGCILITLPNVLFSMSAHFNRKYRAQCIYFQFGLLFFNFLVLLFVPRHFLITIFVTEIILSGIVAAILYALPSDVTPPRSSRRVSSSGQSSAVRKSSSSSTGFKDLNTEEPVNKK